MLKQEQRLRQTRDINRVYARGRFGGGTDIHVKTLLTRLPTSRVAIVVSKKIAKKAVTRNRIKRRLSALIASLWQTVLPGYDIVVSVREDISAATTENMQHQLESALRRSGVIKPK